MPWLFLLAFSSSTLILGGIPSVCTVASPSDRWIRTSVLFPAHPPRPRTAPTACSILAGTELSALDLEAVWRGPGVSGRYPR